MAGSVNKVILVGNLGDDPKINSTQDGRKIANLSVATSESWNDKQTGEKREKTEWHRVVIFSQPLVERLVEPFFAKGMKVYVEGKLQTRKWQDKDGQDRYSTEVVLQGFGDQLHILSGGKDKSGSNAPPDTDYGRSNGSAKSEASKPAGGGFDKMLNDEIPFAPEWR